MSFEVHDYRTVNRNVLTTPEIRARIYHMKPGQVDGRHSHDLGHEIFLILEGQAEFEINGEKKVVEAGQMCIARVDEIHQVRNLLPDKPTIMYLSVTPHIQPTHTFWTNDGWGEDIEKLPPRFIPNTAYDVPVDTTTPTDELLDRHVEAAKALAQNVQASALTQRSQARLYKKALAAGDKEAANQARDEMWDALSTVYASVAEWGQIWNDFAARAAE